AEANVEIGVTGATAGLDVEVLGSLRDLHDVVHPRAARAHQAGLSHTVGELEGTAATSALAVEASHDRDVGVGAVAVDGDVVGAGRGRRDRAGLVVAGEVRAGVVVRERRARTGADVEVAVARATRDLDLQVGGARRHLDLVVLEGARRAVDAGDGSAVGEV